MFIHKTIYIRHTTNLTNVLLNENFSLSKNIVQLMNDNNLNININHNKQKISPRRCPLYKKTIFKFTSTITIVKYTLIIISTWYLNILYFYDTTNYRAKVVAAGNYKGEKKKRLKKLKWFSGKFALHAPLQYTRVARFTSEVTTRPCEKRSRVKRNFWRASKMLFWQCFTEAAGIKRLSLVYVSKIR